LLPVHALVACAAQVDGDYKGEPMMTMNGVVCITDVAAETYAFRLQNTATRKSEIAPSLIFRARAGIGKQW
jgi:hypothetical protein